MKRIVLLLSLFGVGCGVNNTSASGLDSDSSSDANRETDGGNDSALSVDVTSDVRPDIVSDIAVDGRGDSAVDTFSCCPLYTGEGGDCNTIGGSHVPGTPCPETCHGPIIGLKRGTIYCYDIAGCPISVPLVSCVRYVDAGPDASAWGLP